MKQFEFTKDYEQYKKGEVIPMDLNIYHTIIHPLLMKGVLKVIRADEEIREEAKEVIEEIETVENATITDILMNKKMKELQDFGRKYGATDTKKTELIEEILEKVPTDKLKKFVEG